MAWALRILPFVLMLALAGCTSAILPFAKDQPLSGDAGKIVAPPWEAMVKAGPDAGKDIDLETLNGPMAAAPPPVAAPDTPVAAPETPPVVEADAVPAPAPRAKPDKNAVEIKAVAVVAVTGDGPRQNQELTTAMRKVLRDAGWPVLTAPRKDALTVRGRVKIAPGSGGKDMVSIVWKVERPDGGALGDISQNNDVPAGSLAQGWGETAGYAAQAAADGIFQIVQKAR
jgi:hypothetical protein